MFRFLIKCKYNGFYCSRSGWLKNIFIRLNRFSLLNNVCWKTIERFGMFYSQTSDTGSFIRRTIEIVVWNNVESFKFYLFMIFLFFVCFIGIILSFVYSCNKHYPLSCFWYISSSKAPSWDEALLFTFPHQRIPSLFNACWYRIAFRWCSAKVTAKLW